MRKMVDHLKAVRGFLQSPAIGALVLISFAFIYYISGGYLQDSKYNYEDSKYSSLATNIQFTEVSKDMKVDHVHEGYFPFTSHLPKEFSSNLLFGNMPFIAVADINNDSFMDFYVTQPKRNAPNKLYINKKGQGFVEMAQEYGVADLNNKDLSSVAHFADFNNDGYIDLFVGMYGCHKLFLGQPNNKPFVDASDRLKGYCSNARAVNVIDYNGDGFIDIFVGNYYQNVDLNKQNAPWGGFFPRGDEYYGGKNVILKGGREGFSIAPEFDFPYLNHTFAVGIGDINNDGRADVFVGNDLTYDRMYLNFEYGFKEVTDEYIPKKHHGFAGMNSEMVDYNNDGYLDIYVTNIINYPYSSTPNLLWQGTGSGFKQVSEDLGVGKCGWSWGGKFIDFNNNGDLELLVLTGYAQGSEVLNPGEGRSYWFRRTQKRSTPKGLGRYIQTVENVNTMNFSGREKSCFFVKNKDKYVDLSDAVGLHDTNNGRALAVADFDNDGLVDFISGNYNASTLIYKNTSQNVGQWLGFSFSNKRGSSLPIGLKFKLIFKNGKTVMRELFPANGHRGQSDPRFVIGLGNEPEEISHIEVAWPNGGIKRLSNFKMNSYVVIDENS